MGGIKPFKCIQCQYVSYRASNVYCVHYEKSHGRKGNQEDVITDIVERDRMFEIARLEAEAMLQDRNSKLKKSPDPNLFLCVIGEAILVQCVLKTKITNVDIKYILTTYNENDDE